MIREETHVNSLYLIRHAKSARHPPSGGDHERPLVAAGWESE